MDWAYCNSCMKHIYPDDDHVEATKNGITVWFCKEHTNDAVHFMEWFNKFVDFKAK